MEGGARPIRPHCKWIHNVPVPTSSEPSNLVKGSLVLGQRRAFSACLQVFLRHCFSDDYLMRFRQGANDNTTYPCSFTQGPIAILLEPDLNGDPRPRAKGDRAQWADRRIVAQNRGP